MTVSAYTGHVGSGKTYQVVKNVILPALLSGRDVVSNIDGLDVPKIEAYLAPSATGALGALLVVDRLDIRRPDFFPARQADGTYRASQWVPLGSLVVVDEAHFYWGTDKAILPGHMAFFTEHRHITASDGTACDLVVVSQTIGALHVRLKGLVEFSVDCRRLSALGANTKFTAVTYEGAKRSGKYVMGRATHSYDKRIFPLYRSFSTSAGRIAQTDSRFTIWSSKWFWGLVAVAPLLFVGSVWFLWRDVFGSRAAAVPAPALAQSSAAGLGGHAPPPAGSGSLVSRAVGAAAPVGPRPGMPGEAAGPTSPWKIVGGARFGSQPWAVLRRPGFPLRYMPLSACLLSFGAPISCRVGNEVFEPDSNPGSAGSGSTWAVDALASKAAKP